MLTLRTQAGQGIRHGSGSAATLLRGDIFSHAEVANEASSAALTVQGEVGALGACTGAIASPEPLRCTAAAAAGDTDPLWPPAQTTMPPRRAVPDCSSHPWLMELQPGYYDDGVALSRLTTGGACAGKVVWLAPGTYYLNLNFAERTGPCTGNPTPCTWTISDAAATLVAGAPKGWDATHPPSGRAACDPEADGVQIVFGGQSRIDHLAGTFEACGRRGALNPPIALYGLRQGAPVQAPLAAVRPTLSSDVVAFSASSNASQVEEQPARLTADAGLSTLGAHEASVTLSGFQSALPAGSRLDEVKMRIVHRETGNVESVSATVTTTADAALQAIVSVPECDSYCDLRSTDLRPLGFRTAEQLDGLRVKFRVTLDVGPTQTATESLDGIVLEVRYTPPDLQALQGCLTQPYGPSIGLAGCAVVRSAGPSARLVLHGAIYAPTAAVDVDLVGVDRPVFENGLVSGTFRFEVVPAGGYTGPFITVPGAHLEKAILTLRATPGQGLEQVSGSGPLNVQGDVYSHAGVVNHAAEPLIVDGEIGAANDCSGPVDSPADLRCNAPPGVRDADPHFLPAFTIEPVPAPTAVPDCSSWLVELHPGYYDDAAALSRLTSGDPCKGRVVWLTPGAYYFNFNFAEPSGTCATVPARCTWSITDPEATVVGGEPSGWSTTGPAAPEHAACLPSTPGVQLVLGGESRIDMSAGTMEVCPRSQGVEPPISVFGLNSGLPAQSPPATLRPNTVTNVQAFAGAANARDIAESPARLTADAGLSNAGDTKASLTLSGFAPAVPAGARIDEVRVRAVHMETGDVTAVSATVTSSADPALSTSIAVPACSAYCQMTSPDLRQIGFRTADLLAGLNVRFDVALTAGGGVSGTESLDGIVLEVRYTRPALQALSGCLTQPYAPTANPGTGCAAIRAKAAVLVLHGTTYLPSAAVDLDLADIAVPVFGGGIVAGTLRVRVGSSPCSSRPPLAVGTGQGPTWQSVLTACIGGEPKLRTRVIFSPKAPPAPLLHAEVVSWLLL
ncbi:MAG TPA: hypothetical protein VJ777_06130 [Mycobacterium sp.]|nr:hypothetical protein [Mycobacterium sp.]